MNELRPDIARRIIDVLGANGIPPEYGFQYFTVGLEPYLAIIDQEYLGSFIKRGGSAFKLVIGVYGGGKTHFLYCVRDIAWKHNFIVSYVSLSPHESPFHKLELVYRAIVRSIMSPLSADELLSGYEKGIQSFLRAWFSTKYEELKSKGLSKEDLRQDLLHYVARIGGIESISFAKAIRSAFRALLDGREEDFDNICQWLTGEGYDRYIHRKYGIFQKIDRTTAFPLIRSLVQWIKEIGYSGLVVLLDEAERIPSLTTKQREYHLSNLREIIDACAHTSFQGVMIFYAVPDETFLEGRTQIYEALRQRVGTVFDELNPSGVRVELENIDIEPIEFLKEVGQRLRKIYEIAYGYHFKDEQAEEVISIVAETAFKERFGDIGYKRLFVQRCIHALHFLRQEGRSPLYDELMG